MATITDNTGVTKIMEYAGIMWTETGYSSYRNYLSADGRWFISQSFNKYWWLYDHRQKLDGSFGNAKEAMAYAAEHSKEKAAA